MSIRESVRAAARVAVACLLPVLTTAHAGGWESTLTKALVPPAATPMSVLPPDTIIDVTVTLKLRNQAGLDQLVRDQHTPGNPRYGRYLTPAQIDAQFNPTRAQAKAVADYLKVSGFTTVRVSKSHTLVGGTAPAAVVERAFNTTLAQATVNGVTGYINTRAAQVPASLGGVVLSVNGLQSIVRMKSALQQAAERQGFVTVPYRAGVLPRIQPNAASGVPDANHDAFGPHEFQQAYNVGATPAGSNTVIAISTYGDDLSQVIADLRLSEKNNNLPYVPVEVRVEHPIPAGDVDTGGDGEWALDTQSSTGIAGNVKKLVLYTANENVSASLLWQYADFASDASADAPTIGNMSYGTCDVLWPVTTGLLFTFMPDMASADQEFEKAAAEGRSWHASSGDSGGACSPGNFQALPDTGPPGTMYPSSSPYVTAVGGTSLFTDSDGNYAQETAWTSGGGGVSMIEFSPPWQDTIVPSAAAGARGVPDIALDAGLLLLSQCGNVDGATGGCYLGTSLSSPLAAGVWARLQTAHCNQLGFAAPAYYALASAMPPYTATGFNDVIAGSNGVWSAHPGWDYTTGFGSPNVALLNAALPAASGCTPLTDAPVAQLTAPASGAKDAQISFAAAGTDTGDGVAYFAIDFGDDPANVKVAPASQTSFSHAYDTAGTYTVSLYARNRHGVVSAADTKTIVIGASSGGGGGGSATCSVTPGAQLFDDAQFDNTIFVVPTLGFVPGTDLWALQLAQPYQVGKADGNEKLVFTLTVDNPNADFGTDLPLSQGFMPPGAATFVTFMDPDGSTVRGVRMDWDQVSGPNFYSYIASPDNTGATDGRFVKAGSQKPAVGSYDFNAGVVTITVDARNLGLKPGDVMKQFNAQTALTTSVSAAAALPAGAATPEDSMPDNNVRKGSFAIAANTACAPAVANRTPVAALSGPATAAVNQAVTFDASASTDADNDTLSYAFDFGDGTTTPAGAASSASHAYSATGNYTVTVSVSDPAHATSTAARSIAVSSGSTGGSPIVAALSADQTSGAVPLTVGFDASASTDSAGSQLGYTFVYGDGSQSNLQDTATSGHTYSAAGTFHAYVIVTDENSNSGVSPPVTITTTVTVTATPGNHTVARVSANPPDVIIGHAVTFDGSQSTAEDGSTLVSYAFDFADHGSAVVTGTSPTAQHVYTVPGTYNATLTVTDDAARTSQQSVTVTVTRAETTTAELVILGASSGPIPLTVTFDGSRSIAATGATITSYSFDFGDGSTVETGTSATVTHKYTAAGTYTPTLTVTDSDNHSDFAKAATVTAVGPAASAVPEKHGGALGLLTLLPMLGLGFVRRRRTKAVPV